MALLLLRTKPLAQASPFLKSVQACMKPADKITPILRAKLLRALRKDTRRSVRPSRVASRSETLSLFAGSTSLWRMASIRQ